MEQENDKSLFGLSVDAQSRSFLSETAKWGKFLAILGFVMCVFIVLAAVVVATQASEFEKAFGEYGGSSPLRGFGPGLALLYVAFAVIYFFPCLYLLRFSNYISTAMASDSQTDLTQGFKNLKSMFRFVGILTIITIVLYILLIVVLSVSM